MEAVSIQAALKSNIVPYQEYLLQGSILDQSRDVLLHRLQGLCDSIETGPEKFRDHEMVYSIKGGSGSQPAILFHTRHSLDHPETPWHLRYIGQADSDKSSHTLIRNFLDCGTSDNVTQFLLEMGFRLEYEFILKGYLFRKGRMKVVVSKIFKLLQLNNTEKFEPLSLSHLVELSVVAQAGQEQIQEDMKSFAEQLKPLVQLEKIDPKRLPQV